MNDDYIMMIRWAFGDLEFEHNVVQAKIAWGLLHPELPPLYIISKVNPGINVKYIIYQVTKMWVELEPHVDQDKPSLFEMTKVACKDFLTAFQKKEKVS